MARRFVAAYSFAKTPNVMPYTIKSGETFKAGALVLLDTGTVKECSADPTLVLGVALAAVSTAPGRLIGQLDVNGTTVITGGQGNVVSVALCRGTVFTARLVNGGTDPVTPAVADIGIAYGVVKDANGIWAVDQADTTNDVVKVIGIDIINKLVYVSFLNDVMEESD